MYLVNEEKQEKTLYVAKILETSSFLLACVVVSNNTKNITIQANKAPTRKLYIPTPTPPPTVWGVM